MLSCSDSEMEAFQANDPPAEFSIFNVFAGYGSLEKAWDSIPSEEWNQHITGLLNFDHGDSATFLRVTGEILETNLGVLDDMKETLRLIVDTEEWYNPGNPIDHFYNGTPVQYQEQFYGLMEELGSGSASPVPSLGHSVVGILRTVTGYLLNNKTDIEIEDAMNSLVDGVEDLERGDFIDLMELAGKALVAADYPMWLDESGDLITGYGSMGSGTSSGMGNMAKGIHSFVTGLIKMTESESSLDRNSLYDLLDDVKGLMSPEKAPIMKYLISNLEDYFTEGGAAYEANPEYSIDNSIFYSDAELKKSLREAMAGITILFTRDDRNGSLLNKPGSKEYVIGRVIDAVDDIYIDFGTAQISESLYDMLRFDSFGRDRLTDPEAYPASFLESFLFLGAVTTNFGWKHGGSTNELNGLGGDYDDVGNAHGHGEYTGELSLNDSLFAIKSKETGLLGITAGTYDLAFADNETWHREDHIFRSRDRFTSGEKNDYKLYYDHDYGALMFTSGACVGDMGSPDGGNPSGGDGATKNAYKPYAGNGISETNLAAWTIGWIVRGAWEGEGPYYYKDPNAEYDTINGFTGKKYYRPNGKIYALVSDTGCYYYPADGDDPGIDYGAPDFDNSQYGLWGAKRRILYGLEQITTGIKMTRERHTTLLETEFPEKGIDFPEWLFQRRDVDLDLDIILETLVGPNADGTGIAHYPDDKPAPTEPWHDLEDMMADLWDLMDTFLNSSSQYNIGEELFDIADTIITRHSFSDSQMKGTLYTLGRLLASYSGGSWHFQGEEGFDSLFNILKEALPRVHAIVADGTGYQYGTFMTNLEEITKKDGLAGLMYDMAATVGSAPTEEHLDQIYEQWGFQRNNF